MTILATPRKVATTVTASATLAKGRHTPVSASTGARVMTLPTGAAVGTPISVEKEDATANTVTISGSIRGGATTIVLTSQYAKVDLVADSLGSWWPISGNDGVVVIPDSTTTVKGLVELATNAETTTGTDTVRATTPAGVAAAISAAMAGISVAPATTTLAGVVELATTAEGTAGASTTVVPAINVVNSMINERAVLPAGAQTITGVKTFTANPVFNDDAILTSKINGLDEALGLKETVSVVATKYPKPPAGGRVVVRQESSNINDARITTDTISTSVTWVTTYSGQPTQFAAGDSQRIVL